MLQIENSAKEYFFRKKVFSNIKIIEENEEFLLISTKISFEDEILNIVKYWIPYIKIVSPLDLKEKLNQVLNRYLN